MVVNKKNIIFVFLLLSFFSCKTKKVNCETYGSLEYKQDYKTLNYDKIPQEKSRGFLTLKIK